jgi:hypothetical protein
MKIFRKAKQNLFNFLFLGLAGAYGFLPKLVMAATASTPANSAQTNCENFKTWFNGVFDWIRPEYCTAAGLATFAIQTIISFSGVVAALFLIVGGFLYLTSAGNEEQTEKGKKILVNSVIGLVVIILAYAIVSIIGSVLVVGK